MRTNKEGREGGEGGREGGEMVRKRKGIRKKIKRRR